MYPLNNVPLSFMRQLTLLIVLLFGYVGAAFLEEFLVKDTYTCDVTNPNLDCFLLPASMHDRPLNCSDTSSYNNPNDTIECYEFVFNINGGAAAAGGIFTMASLVITAYSWIVIKMSNGRHANVMRMCLTFLFQFVVMVSMTFFPLLSLQFSFSYTQMLNFTAFELIVLFSVFMPWYKFVKEDKVHSTLINNGGSPETSTSPENAPLLSEFHHHTFGAVTTLNTI